MRQLLFGQPPGPYYDSSGIQVTYKGEDFDLAHVLYKFFRSALVHEGRLEENVHFVSLDQMRDIASVLAVGSHRIGFAAGDVMVLDYGWLSLLIEVVAGAYVNREEFGNTEPFLTPKEAVNPQDCDFAIAKSFGTTGMRVGLLREAVAHLGVAAIVGQTDLSIQAAMHSLVRSKNIPHGGSRVGLSDREHQLMTMEGVLLPKGLEVVRAIASNYT